MREQEANPFDTRFRKERNFYGRLPTECPFCVLVSGLVCVLFATLGKHLLSCQSNASPDDIPRVTLLVPRKTYRLAGTADQDRIRVGDQHSVSGNRTARLNHRGTSPKKVSGARKEKNTRVSITAIWGCMIYNALFA